MAIQGFAVIVITTLGFAPRGTSEVEIYVVSLPRRRRTITGKRNGEGKDGKRAGSDSSLCPAPVLELGGGVGRLGGPGL